MEITFKFVSVIYSLGLLLAANAPSEYMFQCFDRLDDQSSFSGCFVFANPTFL